MTDPHVSPEARARATRRALAHLAVPALLAALLAFALSAAGHRPAAHGVLLGAATGLALSATWILGALATFHRADHVLLLATLGLWPLRLVLLFLAAALGAWLSVEPVSLIATLLATHVWGHVIQALTLDALARAAQRR